MNISRTLLRRTTTLVVASVGVLALAACSKPDPVMNTPVVTAAPATPTDMDITSQVKSSLMGDDLLRSLVIDVDTTAGEVRLRGVLDSQAQKDQALVVARAVTGVRGIQDELTLKP